MTGRQLIWRCIESLARDAKAMGLSDSEIAALFLQAATDHAVWVAGPHGASAWLGRLAEALEQDPYEYRGAGYRWLDKLPARLDFAVAEVCGGEPLSTVRSLISAEKLRRLLECEQ
jgi:hypothetical protein